MTARGFDRQGRVAKLRGGRQWPRFRGRPNRFPRLALARNAAARVRIPARSAAYHDLMPDLFFSQSVSPIPACHAYSATRNTSSSVLSPSSALATPSWNMVIMPLAIAALRMAAASRRSITMPRI